MDAENNGPPPPANRPKPSAFSRNRWTNRNRPNYQNAGPRERQFALEIPAGTSRRQVGTDDDEEDGFMDDNALTINIDADASCPLKGWKVYFPHEG